MVGYAAIVWTILRPLGWFTGQIWKADGSAAKRCMAEGAALIGALMLLAFFTFHFGGFHAVHSFILSHFFPIGGTRPASLAMYTQVVKRYWIFLPAAFLAERAAFSRNHGCSLSDMQLSAPYKNVLRMHGLIFFFFLAHFLKLENFAVFTAVYAVYFFPWKLLKVGRFRWAPAAPAAQLSRGE